MLKGNKKVPAGVYVLNIPLIIIKRKRYIPQIHVHLELHQTMVCLIQVIFQMCGLKVQWVSCIVSPLFNAVLDSGCFSDVWYCDTLSETQLSFRNGSSTTDATFALLSLVQNYLNNNNVCLLLLLIWKTYFDSIYRNALWYKLRQVLSMCIL